MTNAIVNLAAAATILSKSAQSELCALAQAGDMDARRDLIQANIRLGYKIAKKHNRKGIQHDDLMAACVEGIIIAIDKFDPSQGASFTTYASRWMTAKCQEHVQSMSGLVHCGSRTAKKLWGSLHRTRRQIGQDATPEQIAQHLDLDADDVRECLKFMSARGTSMDQPLTADGGTLATIVADEAMTQDVTMERTQNSANIYQAVESFASTLKPRQRDILEGRITHELTGSMRRPADSFGVTKQRCGQIEKDLRGKLAAHFTRQFGSEGVSQMISRSF